MPIQPSIPFPKLTLPSWAVNNDILDAIEDLILQVVENMDPPDKKQQEINARLHADVHTMRRYINGTDGTTFTLT